MTQDESIGEIIQERELLFYGVNVFRIYFAALDACWIRTLSGETCPSPGGLVLVSCPGLPYDDL